MAPPTEADRAAAAASSSEWTMPQGKIAILSDPQGAAFAVFEGEIDD